jgi:FtsP/CotA-like multicopper oxidase with cupredoxin domain
MAHEQGHGQHGGADRAPDQRQHTGHGAGDQHGAQAGGSEQRQHGAGHTQPGREGRPAPSSGQRRAQDGDYTCPMHPDVKSDKPGKCPRCGMDLVPVGQQGRHEGGAQHGGPAPQASAATHAGHAAPTPDGLEQREQHAAHGPAHGGPADRSPVTQVTTTQVAVVGFLTVLALAASVLFAVAGWNLTLSAREVGGLVMPPGMVMTRETSAEAMRDMAAVELGALAYTAPADARGDQPLDPRLEGGVKVFDLETSVIRWSILPTEQVAAYAYNRQVPGPRIRVTQGDRVRVNMTNHLPESTTVHWHGLVLPNRFDGPAEITQRPIAPGETYTYEFTPEQAGTFFYHSHDHVDRQQALGLYGVLIVDPKTPPPGMPSYQHELVVQLQEWLFRDGYTFPAMPMEGALPNFFTINGKAYPATETLKMRVGERVRVRFVGSTSAFIHPMHIHGGPFRIVETDGQPVPETARLEKDTVNVGPGERYDVIWEARQPGKWLLHCHINHHTTNNNREEQGGGGLMLILDVS